MGALGVEDPVLLDLGDLKACDFFFPGKQRGFQRLFFRADLGGKAFPILRSFLVPVDIFVL